MRFEDWPERLVDSIKAAEKRPFCWGEFDCALFAADVVLALTGKDYADEFRGKYKTENGAVRMLKKQGGLEAIATRALGAPIPVLMAQRGDVVMIEQKRIAALGICTGANCLFATDIGLASYPLSSCQKAWRAT